MGIQIMTANGWRTVADTRTAPMPSDRRSYDAAFGAANTKFLESLHNMPDSFRDMMEHSFEVERARFAVDPSVVGFRA